MPTADLQHFPIKVERAQRRGLIKKIASVEFRRRLVSAQKLWILDNYFDQFNGIPALEDALETASNLGELRINGWDGVDSEYVKDKVEYLKELILEANGGRIVPTVEWRNTLTQEIDLDLHDRFAIVDEELWHFGATVGGSHRSVTAFSRGWDAIATGAIQFFQDMWV